MIFYNIRFQEPPHTVLMTHAYKNVALSPCVFDDKRLRYTKATHEAHTAVYKLCHWIQ